MRLLSVAFKRIIFVTRNLLIQARPGTPQCLLSGDTQDSAGRNAFQLQNGALYSEKRCNGDALRGPQTRPQISNGDIRPIDNNGVNFGDNPNKDRGRGQDGGRNPNNNNNNNDRDKDRNPDRDRDRDRVSGDPANCRADGLETTFEKVVDHTYDRGDAEAIETRKDIGIVLQCLSECKDQGDRCLSLTLQNERGGRQRCFAKDTSAAVENESPVAQTGVTYYEKVCASKLFMTSTKSINQSMLCFFVVVLQGEFAAKRGLSPESRSWNSLARRMKN